MIRMFHGATAFNADLSGWDVSKVTDMSYMFRKAAAFDQKLSGSWSTSTADKNSMFFNCPGSIVSEARAPPRQVQSARQVAQQRGNTTRGRQAPPK